MKRCLSISFVVLTSFFVTLYAWSNDPNRPDAQLLVLASPKAGDSYYAPYYSDIIKFQADFAKLVLQKGFDNIVILVDSQAKTNLLNQGVPVDVLIVAPMYDIWMRDFSPVNPYNPIQFRYTKASYGSQQQANQAQGVFNNFASQVGLAFRSSSKFLDGGNLVDNYADKIVTTYRFLDDNWMTYNQGYNHLSGQYDPADSPVVAMVPPDDPYLAHADGMIMFVGKDKALLSNFTALGKRFVGSVNYELGIFTNPALQTWVSPGTWTDNGVDPNVSSACGIYVNGIYTKKALYVPLFNNTVTDNQVLNLLESIADVPVVGVTVPQAVCRLGGNVRCLTYQAAGSNAMKLIMAARS